MSIGCLRGTVGGPCLPTGGRHTQRAMAVSWEEIGGSDRATERGLGKAEKVIEGGHRQPPGRGPQPGSPGWDFPIEDSQ